MAGRALLAGYPRYILTLCIDCCSLSTEHSYIWDICRHRDCKPTTLNKILSCHEITWALWRPTTPTTWLFAQHLVHTNNKGILKASRYWLFVRGLRRWMVDSHPEPGGGLWRHNSKISYITKKNNSKMHILWWMGSKLCMKFQRHPLKFHTKFWIHYPYTKKICISGGLSIFDNLRYHRVMTSLVLVRRAPVMWKVFPFNDVILCVPRGWGPYWVIMTLLMAWCRANVRISANLSGQRPVPGQYRYCPW